MDVTTAKSLCTELTRVWLQEVESCSIQLWCVIMTHRLLLLACRDESSSWRFLTSFTHDVCQLVLAPCRLPCAQQRTGEAALGHLAEWCSKLNHDWIPLCFLGNFTRCQCHCQFAKHCAPARQLRLPVRFPSAFIAFTPFNVSASCVILLTDNSPAFIFGSPHLHASWASMFDAFNLMLWVFKIERENSSNPSFVCLNMDCYT